ncbi:MAG: hypothetical protein QOF36_1692 [Microbacteriaceae bacterium]|nr:hypothetical protein [Microbacteriaceae bacterium]
MTTPENLSQTTRWSSIIVVWVAAVLGAIAIGVFSPPSEYAAWLGLTLAGCTIGALCIQLATQQKRGFVDRLAASIVGASIVLAIAIGVLSLLALGH